MRVLTLIDALRLGGAETLLAQLARVSDYAGIDLHVVSLHGQSEQRSALAPLLAEAGVQPHYLDVKRTLDPGSFTRLVKTIKAIKPDIVHAHLEMAMTMGLPAARLAGVPAVGTFHHVYRPISGRQAARERLALEVATRSRAAIFVSRASRTSFAERYRPGRPLPRSWQVIHNGVDLDHFNPSGAVPDLATLVDQVPSGSRVVTILAALRDFKGIEHAIEAWAEVRSTHSDVVLLLVGSGPEEANLRRAAKTWDVEDSVVFAGMRTDVPAILRASEIVLLPSTYGENLPTVLMEAGGCGRPVVASDVGGISDIVVHGETGLLTPPGDAAAIARAVGQLLDHPALGSRLGAAGRERMERLFDARLWASNLRSLYDTAIAHEPLREHSA